MKDIVLLNVRRLAEAYIRQVDKDNTLIACRNLLQLSYKKGLLHKNPFDDLADKWFTYTDRTQKYDNITMLEKYFNNLNNG